MRALILSLIFLLMAASSPAQNLLPNSDFEQFSSCPLFVSQITNCTGWSSFGGGSPDYFNVCAPANSVGIPTNNVGSQSALSGNGYAGISVYNYVANIEYIQASVTPLIVGRRYRASINVSLADKSNFALGRFGMFFYKVSPIPSTTTGALNFTPQASFRNYGIITNKTGWVNMTNTFIADSAYTHAVIGCFFDSSNIALATVTGGANNRAYYYIDDVSLKLVNRTEFSFADTLFCAGDSIRVHFKTDSTGYFLAGNIFTLELSDAAGSFANAVPIGMLNSVNSGTLRAALPDTLSGGTGYRIRIVASSPADTSADNGIDIHIKPLPAKPVATVASLVCTIDTLKLGATCATPGISYGWKGPQGFSSSLQNPRRLNLNTTYSGNYIVTVTSNGCRAKDTVAVTIYQSPDPLISTATTPVCEDDTVKLSTVSATQGLTFTWTGPASFFSMQQRPDIAHATLGASGRYYVTASDINGCIRKDSVSVHVKVRPFVTASGTTAMCIGSNLNLSAVSVVNGASYSWSGPSGFSSQLQNISITNAQISHSGTYTVSASFNGCSASDTVNVMVHAYPSSPAAGSNSPICLGDTIKLNCTGTNVTYNWTGPNGFASTDQNPFRSNSVFSDSGWYRVTVTNAGGCMRKDSVRVRIKPVAVIAAGNSGPVCAGNTINLTASPNTTGASFSWAGPNGFTAATRNTAIHNTTAAASGQYTVTSILNGCSYQATTQVTINPIPVANATSNMPVCINETIMLNASLMPGATYQWTGPNGYTSNVSAPVIGAASPALNGNYIVRVTLNNCISKPDTIKVKVNLIPMIGAYASPSDTICAGTKPTFVAFVQNTGPNPAYQWYRNNQVMNGVTGLVHQVNDPSTGDVFYCKVTAYHVCTVPVTMYSDTIHMVVLPIVTRPEVRISANPGFQVGDGQPVVFTANITNGASVPVYQWYKNDQKMPGAIYATWSTDGLKFGDKIRVDIVSDDPCAKIKTASTEIMITSPTGINDNQVSDGIRLYPNPNKGQFFAAGITARKLEMAVINALGQIVHSETVNNVNDKVAINASLIPGAYLLKLDADGKQQILRFTVSE